MKRTVLAAFLICTCTLAYSKTKPRFETAKVLSQNISSYNAGVAVVPVGGMLAGVPINRRSNTVVVQVGSQRITWSEVGTKTIVLPVNGEVPFYRDGNWFIVIDSKNKKHKFMAVHIETLDSSASK